MIATMYAQSMQPVYSKGENCGARADDIGTGNGWGLWHTLCQHSVLCPDKLHPFWHNRPEHKEMAYESFWTRVNFAFSVREKTPHTCTEPMPSA